jgi:hypothetical protein
MLELPEFAPMRAREGPFVAEQIRLDQPGWDRSAVDLDERPVTPRRAAWIALATRSFPTRFRRIRTVASVSAMFR